MSRTVTTPALRVPLMDYDATRVASREKVPKGLDGIAHRIAGEFRRRNLRMEPLMEEADRVLARAYSYIGEKQERVDEVLIAWHRKVRRAAASGLSPENRIEALAILVDTIRRSTGLTPHREQIMGALVMERGVLAEMATGEGKTLTIGLTAALLAWRGRPCHVITANDYLVTRDADWLRDFYLRCGLTVGTVTAGMMPPDRLVGYEKDITYVTSKEVVADFLRDRLALRHLAAPGRRLIRQILQPTRDPRQATVMRGLHAAIIDEADHVLIDEAATPLIISRQNDNFPLEEACLQAARLVGFLEKGRHYETITRYRDIELKSVGQKVIEDLSHDLPPLWRSPSRREELVRQALVAREYFHRGEQYVITDEGRIAIVDESTGRLMPDRTWRQGLHQAIEAREALAVTLPSETLSRLSFQRFFRLYGKLAGCTGTAREGRDEFWHIYRLPVFRIPTHRPCIRKEQSPALHTRAEDRRKAIVQQVAEAHASGQPVLVGTRSVTESEQIAGLLEERELPFQLLNATRHRQEAAIVMEAGRHGAITIATNMAGRGTDIKLAPGTEELGGLLVIIAEMHGSARIDRQLEGRSARQGEPGEVRLFASLEDDLAQRFLIHPGRQLAGLLLKSPVPFRHSIVMALLRQAQRRSEAQAWRQRREVPKHDEWLSESLAFAGNEIGV